MPWGSEFDDPVVLPDGRVLVSLADAAAYIQKLPRAAHREPAWQTAGEILIAAAEERDFLMHARIGMLRAINRDHPPAPAAPRRKKAKVYNVVPAKPA